MRLSASELAALVGGLVVGDPDAAASTFAIDSRVLVPGACFVALRGERDGHDFAGDAFARGARVALVSRALPHPAGTALVVVDDPLVALGRLAAHVRRGWAGVTVVGITGSAGKTSTKDLAAAAVGAARTVHASPGSFNNEAGLPLTLLGAPPAVEVVVTEMGARFRGDIAGLCAIASPHVGVVTHIGLAHAEHLGGPSGILATKRELVEALPASGTAVLNADEDTTPDLARGASASVVSVGTSPAADVRIVDLTVDAALRPAFTLETPWGSGDVHLSVRGSQQAMNAAMAAAVALAVDVPLTDALAGLAAASPAEWRMELTASPGGIVVLNDAYNASPSSMRAALRGLGGLPATGRRVAVLGDMLELGSHAEAEHADLGRLAAEVGVDLVVAVGPASAVTATHAARAGIVALAAVDRDEAQALVGAHVRPGDAVLVKASRAVGLETVAEALIRGDHDR